MSVKLISITKAAFDDFFLTPEQLIVYVARVSNPENQLNTDTADKLLKYLIVNKHWSPFEMVDMTVEIKTSRAIAQQIIRHRSFNFQEFSQRYSDVFGSEWIELRRAGNTNRQSSLEAIDPMITFNGKAMLAGDAVKQHVNSAFDLYRSLLKFGIARECARFVLPLSTTTTLYMKGSIRSWIHYLELRLNKSTQIEHRKVAEEMFLLFQEHFPVIAEIIKLNGADKQK